MPLPINQILLGDCLEVLKTIPDASVNCIITDPPYGLGTKEPTVEEIQAYLSGKSDLDVGGDFMGYDWSIPSVAIWKECHRVLKPGGHLLSFGGTRSFDLISLGIRAAGFENRDTVASFFGTTTLAWITGQGFPKSLNISKAINKMAGVKFSSSPVSGVGFMRPDGGRGYLVTKNQLSLEGESTEIAKKWEGWGTALKPSWEPILVFRKPLEESTVAGQVLKTGTGGMNIDACRVGTSQNDAKAMERCNTPGSARMYASSSPIGTFVRSSSSGALDTTKGRWPANVLLVHSPNCKIVGHKKVPAPVINRFEDGMKPFGDGAGHAYTSTQTGDADGMEEIPIYECEDGCPVKMLDEQSGLSTSGAMKQEVPSYEGNSVTGFLRGRSGPSNQHGDSGGASRFFGQIKPDAPFFYTGKVSRSERNKGLVVEGFDFSNFVVMREDLSEEDQEKLMAEWPPDFTEPDVPIEKSRVPEKLLSFFESVKRSDNFHATVKPLKLMEWIVKLVSPKGSTVLDPFVGSGTTCIAALNCDCNYIGIEKDPEFHAIALRRIKGLASEIEEKAAGRRQREAFEAMVDLPQQNEDK